MIGFSLDPLTLVIPFFITARAVSHSVQMHDRYYEEYRKANWQKGARDIASFAELFTPHFGYFDRRARLAGHPPRADRVVTETRDQRRGVDIGDYRK